MMRLLGNVIFGLGYVVGAIKYRLGIIVRVPDRYINRQSEPEFPPDTLRL